MVALRLRKLAHPIDESQRLAKVLELKLALDAMRVIYKLPLRHLGMKTLGFIRRQRRDAASAWRAGPLGKGICHFSPPLTRADRPPFRPRIPWSFARLAGKSVRGSRSLPGRRSGGN